MPINENPSVILLGGRENALACARRFTRAGITTVVIDHKNAPALRSRGVVAVPLGRKYDSIEATQWLRENKASMAGAVLIPLSDEAMQGLISDYDELNELFQMSVFSPAIVTAMLNKQTTVELAIEAGVPTPRQWEWDPERISELLEQVEYPVILKPIHGHEARTKHLRADDEQDLLKHIDAMKDLPSGFVFNEFIPGGDGELSSYYALRSAEGEILLEFTKRVDRRNPPNKGGATFHELIDLPATAALGRKFFEHIGLVGMGNVEFKHDQRTGELKIIECNHRLTAALPLMQDNGIDLAGAVYDQALGRNVQAVDAADLHGVMWYPVRDLISFRMSGEGVGPWLRRPWLRATFPYWRLTDPVPSIRFWIQGLRHSFRKHTKALRR